MRKCSNPGGLVIDPSGLLAFESDPASGLIYRYAYADLPGYWSTMDNIFYTPFTFTAQAGAGPVITDPAGHYLIVANQTAKSISLFDYTGGEPISPTLLAYTPLAIAMDPTGNLLFVSGDDLQLHLLINNGFGLLTDSSDVTLAGSSSSVAVEPGGHFVYAAGAAGLSAFSINQTTDVLGAYHPEPAGFAGKRNRRLHRPLRAVSLRLRKHEQPQCAVSILHQCGWLSFRH
jgi:6-phosphogluconolactonase (cycloisomerase 2 family)